MIYVNARFRKQAITGVQRYAREICDRIQRDIVELIPGKNIEGPSAHLWEQAVLPFRVGRGILWNPCATGPICKRSIVTVHDMAFSDHPEWFSNSFGTFYRAVVPRLAKSAHHVICGSEFTRERLQYWTGIPSSRISVIPYGPVKLATQLPDIEAQAFLEKNNLNQRQFILSVGSQDPRKNQARLLNAWKKARQALPEDSLLVLAGGGRPSVFSYKVEEKDPLGVIRTGYVSDAELRLLYEKATAFIFPSLYEGFGLPPLEAMQLGCPVLVSRSTSLPEVVGDAGEYFDPLSEESISQAIERVFSDSEWRDCLASKGKLHASKFSWDQSAKGVLDILLGVKY